MSSIKLRSHVGEDGILHLDVSVGITDTELEVIVTVQPVTPAAEVDTPQGKGWPPGFFEDTFGCFKDDPLVWKADG